MATKSASGLDMALAQLSKMKDGQTPGQYASGLKPSSNLQAKSNRLYFKTPNRRLQIPKKKGKNAP